MKQVLYYTVGLLCLICIISGVILIYKAKEALPNGFTRSSNIPTAIAVTQFSTKGKSLYIAGQSPAGIFLGDNFKSGCLLQISWELDNIKSVQYEIPEHIRFAWGSSKFFISYPHVYLSEGVTPHLFSTTYPSQHLSQIKADSFHFDFYKVTNSFSLIARTFDNNVTKMTLTKSSLFDMQAPKKTMNLTYDQDSVFSVDGQLLYNSNLERLAYVYYYKNLISILDTNLNTISQFQTIDTFSHTNLKFEHIVSQHRNIISGNKPVNNRSSFFDDTILYVNSNLLSDNEDPSKFTKNSVIDLYNIRNGEYQHSFYVPKVNKKPINEFVIQSGFLVAIYPDSIVSYNLPPL